MYSDKELKKIKIAIKNNIPEDVNTIEEETDYSFSYDEKLPIHIRSTEGTKPLFNEKFANRESTPSRISSRQNTPSFRENENGDLGSVLEKLQQIKKELEGKVREAEVESRNPHKRNRRERESCSSRNSTISVRSRSNSHSPRRKRMRRNPEYSRYNIDNKRKNRYRNRSRSSSSDRSFSSFLSRKLKTDASSLLNDSRKNSRNNKKYESNYYKKSGRKSDRTTEDYHNDDYYRHGSYYHDMKQRYARYYTVMYAFNIIMDILRKDDLSY